MRYIRQLDQLFDCGFLEMLRNGHKSVVVIGTEHARTTRFRSIVDTNGFMVRKKVICIEDDRETAALIAEELTDRGYEVILAYDGEEGLAAIRRADPDLVISDICMPLMSGFEVLERLTIRPPRSIPPFIFLTALTDRDFKLKGRNLGADDYITKPVDFDRLAGIILGRLGTVRPSDLRKEWGRTPGRAPLQPRLLKSPPGPRAR